jgi:carbonic anhydrase
MPAFARNIPVLAAVALVAAPLFAAGEDPGVTPHKAFLMLLQGNARFVSGKPENPNTAPARLLETSAQGQKPFAAVLACADSRVPVERLFDRGFGDLFVVRVAGNVCGPDELGSLEYAVAHLNVPVVVVLGHTNCGAVAAATQRAEAHGAVGQILEKIAPAVAACRTAYPALPEKDLARQVVPKNALLGVEESLKRSAVLREKSRTGKLTVVAGVYDIADGQVFWLGEHPACAQLVGAPAEAPAAAHAPAPVSRAPEPPHAPAAVPERVSSRAGAAH